MLIEIIEKRFEMNYKKRKRKSKTRFKKGKGKTGKKNK